MAWKNRANIHLARELRTNATMAERNLWQALSNRKVSGVRFNRQVCIGPFICDSVARTQRVVIEVDGGQHAVAAPRDLSRAAFLKREGYQVLRFWNHDVLNNLEGVIKTIEDVLTALPRPLPQAGGAIPSAHRR